MSPVFPPLLPQVASRVPFFFYLSSSSIVVEQREKKTKVSVPLC